MMGPVETKGRATAMRRLKVIEANTTVSAAMIDAGLTAHWQARVDHRFAIGGGRGHPYRDANARIAMKAAIAAALHKRQ